MSLEQFQLFEELWVDEFYLIVQNSRIDSKNLDDGRCGERECVVIFEPQSNRRRFPLGRSTLTSVIRRTSSFRTLYQDKRSTTSLPEYLSFLFCR